MKKYTEEESSLDKKYQDGFKFAPKDLKAEWMPPCPRCEGEMKFWDAWLVTGATCSLCSWSMCEGSGCLV